MSVIAYQSTQLQTASPLSLEIMAFQKITNALERSQAEAPQDLSAQPVLATQRHVRLCDAVYQNTRLWLTLLEDLNNPANRLSADLKAGLAGLAATSIRHGRQVLAGKATLNLLIDINRAIAAGLSQARAIASRSVSSEREVRYAGGQA
jgi:flagellar protein FlaF